MVFRRQTVDTNERHVIINCQQTCCCRISFGSQCVHNSISGYRFLKALTFGHIAARTILLRLCSFLSFFSHSFHCLSVAYCDLSASMMKRHDRRLTDNHGKLTVCFVTIYFIFFLLSFFPFQLRLVRLIHRGRARHSEAKVINCNFWKFVNFGTTIFCMDIEPFRNQTISCGIYRRIIY